MPFVTPARSVPIALGVHPDGSVGRAGHTAPQMITKAERDALLDPGAPRPVMIDKRYHRRWSAANSLLRRQDSNLNHQNQNLRCCHYTTADRSPS
jgi:hypothetical protein